MKNYLFIFWYLLITAILIILGFLIFRLHDFGYPSLLILLVCFYLLNLFFVMLLFLQTRKSIVKLSWIMVITIVPFLGYLIFIIFGQKIWNRISKEKYQQNHLFNYENLKTKSNINLFNKQSHFSKRGIYQANFELISLNIGSYEKMFTDLKKATKNIYIQFYIIKPGEIYQQLKKILIEKSQNGVEVKLIVDDFGRWALPWYEIKELKSKGIKIGVFGPVRFPFVGSQNGYRMHRKMVLIDNQIVYTGGINVASEYANNNKKYGLWLDAQFKITGPLVNSYLLLFANDWESITSTKISMNKKIIANKNNKKYRSSGVLVEDSPKINEFILEKSITNWIFQAKKEIKITTPYFVPTQGILDALKTVAQSGVKVTIFIPGKPDKKTVLFVSKFWAKQLIPYKVNFRITNDILIHSKLAVFDNKYAYLGTANLDIRSLSSQYEFLNLVSGKIVEDINEELKKYEKLSNVWIPKNEPKNIVIRNVRNFFIRFFALLFSPLM